MNRTPTALAPPDDSSVRRLTSNFVFVSAVQATNFLLPLLVYPYVLRVVGLERFGILVLAQAVMSYGIVLVDYGFSLSAVRKLARCRDNPQAVAQLVAEVTTTRFVLTGIAAILLIAFTYTPGVWSAHRAVFWYSYTLVIGQAFLPLWFFQGMEQMKWLTVLNLSAKLLFGGLIFVVVQTADDYHWVNALLGGGNAVAGLAGLWLIRHRFNVPLRLSSPATVWVQLREGRTMFWSNLSVTLYMNSNILILSYFVSPVLLGFYGIADKIIMVAQQILVVYFQVVYPHVCRLIESGLDAVVAFYRRAFLPFAGLVAIGCLGLYGLSDWIVGLFAGQNQPQAASLLRGLSAVPFIICLNIPFNQLILATDRRRAYSLILTTGLVVCLTLNLILTPRWGAIGTVWAVNLTQLCITLTMSLFVITKKDLNRDSS